MLLFVVVVVVCMYVCVDRVLVSFQRTFTFEISEMENTTETKSELRINLCSSFEVCMCVCVRDTNEYNKSLNGF